MAHSWPGAQRARMRPSLGTFAYALGVAVCGHGAAHGADRPRVPEPPPAYAVNPAPEPGRRPFPDAPRPPARPEVAQQDVSHHFEPPRFEPPRGRVCFNPAETREKIVAHRLADPFQALRDGRLQGEALRAKLCRWRPDEFIYEVAVLLRDGRVVHVYMNAQNGQTVGALEPRR